VIKHAYTATGTNDGAKQVSVDRWNQDHIIDSELDLPLITPATPAADTVSIFGKKIGGRMMVAQMGPSGLDTSLQAHLGGNKVGLWIPPGNASTVPGVFGIGVMTATGTATARTVATTSFATRMARLGYVSAATAGALSGIREGNNKYSVGAGNGIGGFFYRLRFVPSDAAAVSGERFFAGLWGTTTAPTNVEPSTLTNCLGICQLSTSSNLQIYGAGASASTPVDLGSNFPATGLSTDAYEFSMFAKPDGTVTWQVDRLGTAFTASGTFAAVPSNTTLLGHQIWKTNNATALAVGVDICSLYIETDN
jgi:hypothetical protein